MIKLLQSLFGSPARNPAAGITATTVKDRTAVNKAPATGGTGDYRAVSLAPGKGCTAARTGAITKRYLLRDAPRLPLAGCSQPSQCGCKFRKHADRRDYDRRLLGATAVGIWYAGAERRSIRCRRRSQNA